MSIEDVKITNIDAFVKLHSLKVLRISSQHNFSEIVSKLRGLKELYVNFYEHKLDGKYFSKMLSNTKINLIDITGHKLRSVASNAFAGLARNVNLKVRLRKTMISDLPAGIFYALKYIPKLSIDLIDNKLSTLSPDMFYPNTSAWDAVGTRSIIGGIDVAGNPLLCDCDHVWLGHWLRRWLREISQVNVVTKEEAKQMLTVSNFILCILLTHTQHTHYSHSHTFCTNNKFQCFEVDTIKYYISIS